MNLNAYSAIQIRLLLIIPTISMVPGAPKWGGGRNPPPDF